MTIAERDAAGRLPGPGGAAPPTAGGRWTPTATAPAKPRRASCKQLGAADLAWDYLTTPVDRKPNEAAPWLSLARTLTAEGSYDLADRAYAAAFEAEPTNAQLLWDRAAQLQQPARRPRPQGVFRQLAEGEWQPRFGWMQEEARRRVVPGH